MQYPDNFNKAFEALIGNEGGYVNNKGDPGGETNWGIAKRSYPNVNIKALTLEDAKVIYYKDFWLVSGSEFMSYAVVYEVFDAAVNHGISRAIKLLQQAVKVEADGVSGRNTINAARVMDESDVLLRFNAFRLKFYTGLKTWPLFGKGWANRVADNLLRDAENN